MMRGVIDQAYVLLQSVLPTRLLSTLMHKLTESRLPWLKDAVIAMLMRSFDIKLDDYEVQDPRAFDTVNAFFTRALRADARPIDTEANLVSPVDGTISELGPIQGDTLIQAKGMHYSLSELLGSADLAEPFIDGQFATIYLSPQNYHRIHMPQDGQLVGSHYVPGRLFAVNPSTVRTLPRVFARNERLTLMFDTADGPMAMVLVGAMLVGSIQTPWDGKITPPYGSSGWSRSHDAVDVARGAEVGRFNMGSTVIVLRGAQAPGWRSTWAAADTIWLGQGLA